MRLEEGEWMTTRLNEWPASLCGCLGLIQKMPWVEDIFIYDISLLGRVICKLRDETGHTAAKNL
jgi:hypothetical protein